MSRDESGRRQIEGFMRAIGAAATSDGCVYLTGGATAVLHGWRDATVDIDFSMDPEPQGIFSQLQKIKDTLNINLELASPSHFIPPVPGWDRRSIFIQQHGRVRFYHYDLVSQALSKIERGHDRDLADVASMISSGHLSAVTLLDGFSAIVGELMRYPSIDPDVFSAKVKALVDSMSAKDAG